MTEAFSQPPFVGDSRHRVVDGLVDILDEMNSTGEPRWVSLEAPSGWGKTRVVQEFYARLAARQSNHYWPETILGASDVHGFEVGDRRKRRCGPAICEKGAFPNSWPSSNGFVRGN